MTTTVPNLQSFTICLWCSLLRCVVIWPPTFKHFFSPALACSLFCFYFVWFCIAWFYDHQCLNWLLSIFIPCEETSVLVRKQFFKSVRGFMTTIAKRLNLHLRVFFSFVSLCLAWFYDCQSQLIFWIVILYEDIVVFWSGNNAFSKQCSSLWPPISEN